MQYRLDLWVWRARCLRFSLKMENLSMASTKCGGQHFHFSEYCRETGDYP